MVLKKTAKSCVEMCDRTVENEMKCCWNLIKPEWYALWWLTWRTVYVAAMGCFDWSGLERYGMLKVLFHPNGIIYWQLWVILFYVNFRYLSTETDTISAMTRSQMDCTIHKCLVNGISISHSVSVVNECRQGARGKGKLIFILGNLYTPAWGQVAKRLPVLVFEWLKVRTAGRTLYCSPTTGMYCKCQRNVSTLKAIKFCHII